jgi:hypothetical protein
VRTVDRLSRAEVGAGPDANCEFLPDYCGVRTEVCSPEFGRDDNFSRAVVRAGEAASQHGRYAKCVKQVGRNLNAADGHGRCSCADTQPNAADRASRLE